MLCHIPRLTNRRGSSGRNDVRMHTYVARPDSTVELVPAIRFGIDGDDLPKFRPFDPKSDVPGVWAADRTAWYAEMRTALGLRARPELDGLLALDDIREERLLHGLTDRVVETAKEYGWSAYIDGGLALIVDQQLFAGPECCVFLNEALADWKQLGVEWPSSWTNVECGHPGVLARQLGDRIEICRFNDSDEVVSTVDLPIAALQQALVPALESVNAFAERLADHLTARGVEDAHHCAQVVAGLVEV
jgi:hypothetical protein